MEKTTVDLPDVPTALPGVEEDDAREKLLLDNASDELEDTSDEDTDDAEAPAAKPNKRRRQVLGTFGAFAVFLSLMVIAVAWFFEIGWFSKPQAQAVNRSGQKVGQTSPVTEDEKLNMALNMVAPTSSPVTGLRSNGSEAPLDIHQTAIPASDGETDGTPAKTGPAPIAETESYSLPQPENRSKSNPLPTSSPNAVAAEKGNESVQRWKAADSDEARGRSLFFGISKPPVKEERIKATEPTTPKPIPPIATSSAEIPFGTMLPVRLIGSIYTLRNSGGFVRLELTRPVEGKGYSYPAGTMIVGNVRGGESVRAFVNIVGLIDPVSGEFVKFSGELLGRDGASGIEGKRRNLTSQWARFFRGMKDTAGSVLGAIGTLRSGGTVILSEPMRRGSDSMTEDLSGALLENVREDTFLEVAAGSNGYVLVTGLPEKPASPMSKSMKGDAQE